MLVDGVTAILLISPQPQALVEFYISAFDLAFEEEAHEGGPLHYGCPIGDVHLAIHSAEEWGDAGAPGNQTAVIAFSAWDLEGIAERVTARGVEVKGPSDHGFGMVLSFRDPDGNRISVIREYDEDQGDSRETQS